MKKNKKRGFTLVELLAVIVVLAIILVIAVPKILDVIKSSRENSLISSVKLVARNAEQKLLTNEVLGESTDTFSCDEVADINTTDYKSCNIDINNETKEVTVTIEDKGKFSGYTCSGTKNNVTCGDAEPLVCAHGYEYDNIRMKDNLSGDIKNECVSVLEVKYLAYGCNNAVANSYATLLCKNELAGWIAEEYDTPQDYFDEYDMTLSDYISNEILNDIYTYDDIKDYFDADVVGCSENYLAHDWIVKSEFSRDIWAWEYSIRSITFHKSTGEFDGSGIDVSQAQDGSILLYKTANGYDEYSDTTTYDVDIVSNEKIYFPVYSTNMFALLLNVESIDFNDSIDTSKVTNMESMFYCCESLEELDLSGFNTSNVTNMESMFGGCESLEELDLSSFNTSNVTNMSEMFCGVDVLVVENSNFIDIDNDEIYECPEEA